MQWKWSCDFGLPACESILQSPVAFVSLCCPIVSPSLCVCVCVCEWLGIVTVLWLFDANAQNSPTNKKKTGEKKLYRSLPVWFFRLLCSVFGPYALLERSTQHHRPPLRHRHRSGFSGGLSASASASQSSAPRGYSLGFELKSYHFCVVVVLFFFFVFFFRFALAPLSFAFARVRCGVRLNNIYLIYFYFYFINLIFFNWTSSSLLALFASQSDYWLFGFRFFFCWITVFGFSICAPTFVRSLCTLFKSYVVKPLFRPKHVCFNDFLLVLAPAQSPPGRSSHVRLRFVRFAGRRAFGSEHCPVGNPPGAWLVSQLVGIMADMLILINWSNLELPATYISSPQT